MMPRASTSAETAARFLALFDERTRREQTTTTPREQAAAFRELVLSHVCRLRPMMPCELHQAVENDWGPVCRRRLERAIRWLVDQGEIMRTPDGYLLARGRR